MSFRNTKTPRMSEIEGKARYQVPSRLVRGLKTYYLTPELERHFRRLFPVTMNRDMMRLFGISHTTIERFKCDLGLSKNMRTIRHKHAQQVKRTCEENGYYDSLRGKQPSEACIDAAKRKRASGFHPMKALKQKNPRKYRRVVQQLSEARRELIRKERIRVNWGLGQDTNIHIPYDPYGKKQKNFRHTCQAVGYIPGNAHDPAERWKIFYTQDTKRGTIREQHGTALGFKFEPLTTTQQ